MSRGPVRSLFISLRTSLLQIDVWKATRPNVQRLPRAHPISNMASGATPEAVTIGDRKYRQVREGLASVLAPYKDTELSKGVLKPRNNDEGHQAVFYNPIQQFNRDLSVLAILVYGQSSLAQRESQREKKQSRNRKQGKGRPGLDTQPQVRPSEESNDGAETRKRKRDPDSTPNTQSQQEDFAKRPRVQDNVELDELDEPEVIELEHQTAEERNIKATDVEQDDKATGPQPPNTVPAEQANISTTESAVKLKRRGPSFTILDALSATGLRALRYAKEIPFATKIIANDLLPEATRAIDLNIQHNDLEGIVFSNVGDARALMYSKVGNEITRGPPQYVHRFDVIDLDPYGTAVPFLDAAVQAISDGGLLCVTCTDAGVFASVGYLEKSYVLYGGLPLKGIHSHEAGLRLILHAIAASAAKYGLSIEPLLSLSIDFYARVFVRVNKSQNDLKLLAGTTMLVYNCDAGCGAWTTQPLARNRDAESRNGQHFFKYSLAQSSAASKHCDHCGAIMHLGGPTWAGPIHNPVFVQKILQTLPTLDAETYGTLDRLEGMLTLALEEGSTDFNIKPNANGQSEIKGPDSNALNDHIIPRMPPHLVDQTPLYFVPSTLAKVLHCETPSEDQVRGALLHLGYRVTRSHCKAGSIKTNAPWNVIWEIMREWVRTKKPIREDKLKAGSSGWVIMGRMRDTERSRTQETKDDLIEKMSKSQSPDELKTVLESAMYQLEHPKAPTADKDKSRDQSANGINGNSQAKGDDHQAEEDEPRVGQRSTSPTSGLKDIRVIFDERLGAEKPRGKLVRYQMNPRADWGPMNRAGRK